MADLLLFDNIIIILQNFRADRSAAVKKEKETKDLKIKEDIIESRFANIEESILEIEDSLPTSSTVR
jgi:predicted  nucleic acid-binding Zn-ribbon protein